MKIIFKVLDIKNKDGKWYEKYEVSESFPFEYPYIEQAPPEILINPRYLFGTGWVEDDEALLETLMKGNASLKSRLDITESAVLDLADQILTREGGAV